MTAERAKRKLSAVLSADVKGYSRLMGEDEMGTVKRLKAYRALMTDLIQQFRGRVVDSPGDNLLAEFASVVDATECAVKIQEELSARNAELPASRQMNFRIGINLGDLIEDGDRIYGDGVNIAVLPFINLSSDSSQEYFSDGITEQIITGLSKVPQLFVIARNSTFTYKGQPLKVQQVGRELGVRYVLEGSVQKSGDRVRISAQLIDTTTGHHLWADNYDRDLQDIFALQDEITLKIMTAMQVQLTEGEQARLWEGGTTNIQAFDKLSQAMEYIYRVTKQDNAQARRLFKEAIAQDPAYAAAYSGLAATHLMDAEFGWSKSPRKSMELAIRLTKKTLALNDAVDYAYGLLGNIHLYHRRYQKAIAAGERATALNPNGAHAHAWLGYILCVSGRPQEGLVLLQKAIRLNPIPPNWYLGHLAIAYRMTGRYEDALEVSQQVLNLNPDDLSAHLSLAITYGLLDRKTEAHAAAAEVLRIDPHFSIEYFAKTSPIRHQATRERLIDALRKAGLM